MWGAFARTPRRETRQPRSLPVACPAWRPLVPEAAALSAPPPAISPRTWTADIRSFLPWDGEPSQGHKVDTRGQMYEVCL